MKLVDAVHILCSTSISEVDLKEAEKLLLNFTREHEVLFDKSGMVFNVHLLNHLCECV